MQWYVSLIFTSDSFSLQTTVNSTFSLLLWPYVPLCLPHIRLFTSEDINPLASLFPFCLFFSSSGSVYYPVCLLPSICLTAPNDPKSVSCLSSSHLCLPVILSLCLFVLYISLDTFCCLAVYLISCLHHTELFRNGTKWTNLKPILVNITFT